MLDDLRHAIRRLRSQPATAALAAVMLALAIGISSAMVTIVDSLILRPAPFAHSETLAWLAIGKDEKNAGVNIPAPIIKSWIGSEAFASAFAIFQAPATFGSGDEAQTVAGARVTPGTFEALGVAPMLGRTFRPGEGRAGDDRQILLSEPLWRSRFAADPAIVGRRIDVSGSTALVVGVMPERFAFPFANTQVWQPVDLSQPSPAMARRNFGYAYARLRTDLSREQAARVATGAAVAVDPKVAGQTVFFEPIGGRGLDDYSSNTVKVLAAGVALVFVVLCANVMNLMLARLDARRREFALSSALGASRARLLSQAACEQVVIGVVATLGGLAIAAVLIGVARASLPDDIIARTLNRVAIDGRAVAGSSAFGFIAILLAGLLPAWIGTRERPAGESPMASRGSTPTSGARATTRTLLVVEVAVAVALSVAAGVQLRSFVNLLHEDRGFDADRLVTFPLGLPAANFPDPASRYVYAESLRASISGRPGIQDAVLSRGVPPSGGDLHFYDVTTDTPGAAPVHLVMHGYDVAPSFFATFGIRLLEGRGFDAGDPPGSVIISRSMASALWPGSRAEGRGFSFGSQAFHVVGVVGEIRNSLSDPRLDLPELYEPLLTPGTANAPLGLTTSSASLTIRCGDGCPPVESIRADLKTAAPRATVGAGKRLADEYVAGLARPRAGAVVAITFAAVGLAAVALGLFAVLSRVVLQREREFGVRMALGASPADIRRLVQADSVFVAVLGLGAGALVAWALSRALASVQYQVQSTDATTWAAVILTLAATILLAAWRPARRAMRVDPARLLRES
jgi:putative ABC transport system permease protein